MAKKLTSKKARQILHDKSVHGHPLTDKQRRFFGAIAGGAPMKAETGGWLDSYQDGGPVESRQAGYTDIPFNYNSAWGGQFQKGGTLPPIFTDDPRKVQDYTDSLKLYKENFNQLRSEKLNFLPKFLRRIPFNSIKDNEYAQNMFERNDAWDTRSKGEVYPEKIKPIYFDIHQIGDKTQHSAYYKKPVQPYVLKELNKQVTHIDPISVSSAISIPSLRTIQHPDIQMSGAVPQGSWNVEYFNPDSKKTEVKHFISNEDAEKFYNDPANRASRKYSNASSVGRMQLGGNVYPVNYVPQAQDGISFLPQQDPEMMYTDRFNTPLNKKEEKLFNEWVAKESERQGRDIMMDKGAYDVQGFWKSGDYKKMDKDNHGVDTWKKPNHPTFSNQSKYHGVDGFYGGTWNPDGGYQPSKQTASMYGPSYYDWMFGLEPNRPEHLDASRYTSGANKPSPLYYAMGGSIPGSVGFTYARTQGAAPSNGPHAKKTLASAQDGKTIHPIDLHLPKYEAPKPFFTGYGFSQNPAPNVDVYGVGAYGTGNINDRLNLSGNVNSASVFYPGGEKMFMKPRFEVGMKYKFDNGGSMSYYQNGLDWKPKTISKNGGWLDKYVPQAQTGFELATGIKPITSLTNVTDVIGRTEPERLKKEAEADEINRRNRATDKRTFISQGQTSTPESERARAIKNRAFAAQNAPYVNIDENANLSQAFPDASMTGELRPGSRAAKAQKGVDDMITALEYAGYVEGLGVLGSAAKKAIAQSMESGLLSKAYKINPWAIKENPEMFLYRARPVGQDINMNMGAQLRAKQAAGEPLTWYQKNLLNPQTNPELLAREKYYGQWFEKDPNRLDWYMDPATRNFADNDAIEILRTRLPKSEAAKLNISQFPDAKVLSASPETEFILPKGIIESAERFPESSLQQLIQEHKKFNTPNWLRGYKEVPKPTTGTLLPPQQAGFPNPLAIADAIVPQLPHPVRIPLMGAQIENMGPFTGSPLNFIPGYGKVLEPNPNAAFRKFGNSMQHVIDTKTLSPKGGASLRMGRDQIVGEGNWAALNNVDENYKGTFAAKFDFRNPNTNLGYVNPSDRNGVLITTKSGDRLVDIPIQDEGLSFHRRLPFSNRYIPIDKEKLLADKFQWSTQGGHLQSLAEKYGYGLGYAGALGGLGFVPNAVEKYNQYTIDPIKNWTKEQWENYKKSDVYKKFRELDKSVGLDFLYNKKKKGGIIKDDRGQWDHPGEITEIGSNRITMQGVPYPVLGISDTGHTQMMFPGEEYKFIGKKVTEIPMAQNGMPTRADSIVIMNNAIAKNNFYKNNPNYRKVKVEDNNNVNFRDPRVLQSLANATLSKQNEFKNIDANSKQTLGPFGKGKTRDITFGDLKRRVGKVAGTSNVYSAPDIISETGIDAYFNPDSPPIFFSPSILPQGAVNYQSVVYGDQAYSPYYDPLAVKPYDMRTPQEKIEWEKKYGRIVTHYTDKKGRRVTKIEGPKTDIEQTPSLKKKVTKMEPIPSKGKSTTPQIRTIEQPNIELPDVERGQYRTSYYDPQMKDWNERAFMSQQESNKFANEMSSRGYGGAYGNVTQTKKVNKKETGGWLNQYK